MSARIKSKVIKVMDRQLTAHSIHGNMVRCSFDESRQPRYFEVDLTSGTVNRVYYDDTATERVKKRPAGDSDFKVDTDQAQSELEKQKSKEMGNSFSLGFGDDGSYSSSYNQEIILDSSEIEMIRWVNKGEKNWANSDEAAEIVQRFANQTLDVKHLIQDLSQNSKHWDLRQVIACRRYGGGLTFLNGWTAENIIEDLISTVN